jgi:hypothetical protein
MHRLIAIAVLGAGCSSGGARPPPRSQDTPRSADESAATPIGKLVGSGSDDCRFVDSNMFGGALRCGSDAPASLPIVALSDVVVSKNAFSERSLRRAMRPQQDTLLACYVAALRIQPTFAGRFDGKLAISADGRVTSAVVIGTGNAAFERCVADALVLITLPAPSGGIASDVTFVLVLLAS